MVKRFSHHFQVAAPLEEVAEFHQESLALKKLTPFPIFIQVHKQEELGEGSIADFTMWLGPFPVRWVALHKNMDPLRGFTDIQTRGPFAYWEHTHTFRALDAQTSEVIDEINALPGITFLNKIVSYMMWSGLPLLFAFRSWATRKIVEGRVAEKR
jgi:ligand-binding SRPBCC domain-containing protein